MESKNESHHHSFFGQAVDLSLQTIFRFRRMHRRPPPKKHSALGLLIDGQRFISIWSWWNSWWNSEFGALRGKFCSSWSWHWTVWLPIVSCWSDQEKKFWSAHPERALVPDLWNWWLYNFRLGLLGRSSFWLSELGDGGSSREHSAFECNL